MNHAFSLTQAAADGGALRALGAGYVGRVAMTRAGPAMVLGQDGNYQPASAHAIRFNGSQRRMLVEEARSNLLRNPLGEGAAIGLPGTMPTFWLGPAATLAAVGLSLEVLALPAANIVSGLPCLRLRISGTATADQPNNIRFDMLPAVAGSRYTGSFFLRTVSGSTSAFSIISPRLRMLQGSSTQLAGAQPLITPTTTLTRFSSSADAPEGTDTVQFLLQLNTLTTAVNWTFDLGLPQLEQGASASSPILPAAGSLTGSSRAADLPVWTPAGGFPAQGTVIIRAMLPQIAPFGASQGLWQIDDGTDQNRILLRNTSAGSAITGVVDQGGTTLATLSAGNMTAGAPFRVAFAWSPGSQAISLNGAAVQTAAAALPPGLSRMLIGHGSTQLNRAANGEVELLDYYPSRLPNARLQALAAA